MSVRPAEKVRQDSPESGILTDFIVPPDRVSGIRAPDSQARAIAPVSLASRPIPGSPSARSTSGSSERHSTQFRAGSQTDGSDAARFDAASADTQVIARMVERMRAGDPEAVAWFITRFGPLIQRRVRSKLGPSMRRLYDSQEILSTVSRRLLRFVSLGKLEAQSESELWSLVYQMTQGALVDKIRVIKRLRATEGPDSEFAGALLARVERAESGAEGLRSGSTFEHPETGAELELESLFKALPSPDDKEVLSLWLNGVPHAEIARQIGTTPAAVRQRWQAVKARLRSHLTPEPTA